MVAVHSGSCVAYSAKDPEDKAPLFKGSFFGEEVLLTADSTGVLRRRKTVQAVELCHLYVLEGEDYREVIKGFPEYVTVMKEAAERRLEVAALRARLRQHLASIEEDKHDLSGDENDSRVVARRLAYLQENAEAIIAATIMQRGWRFFRWVLLAGTGLWRVVGALCQC